VNDPILNHSSSLSEYRASPYFAGLPTASAESGSLSLCTIHFLSLPSDPSVTRNALAIQIDFPSDGVSPLSFKRTGLPALPGKQKAPTTEVMRALVLGLLKKRAFNNSYSDPNLPDF